MENVHDGPDELIIAEVEPGCREAIDLQWEMRRELDLLYGETTIDPPPLMQFRRPRAAFLVAWYRGEAIGCGAITDKDERTAHIKRVFVTPGMRGRGFGRRIMQAVELKARDLGYSKLFLETAELQLDAMRMYEAMGFRRVPCGDREKDGKRSVCYEKGI